MPELAEVEYFRQQWNAGLGQTIRAIHLHPEKRIFRSVRTGDLEQHLPGAKLLESESHGKLMCFRFSGAQWLGLHLGMTGRLLAAPAGFAPGKHDHLALAQKKQTLVFQDPRLFGRVYYHRGIETPSWWSERPPALLSSEFTLERVARFLEQHGKLPVKTALLLQEGFPGIGNWMADEILWRSRLHPRLASGQLGPRQVRMLRSAARWVARHALRLITPNFEDPPDTWLFPHRWSSKGTCPRHPAVQLTRQTLNGRTAVWCSRCQTVS